MLSDRLGEKFQFLLELVLYLYYKIPKGSARYKPPLKSLSKNVSERVLAKQKTKIGELQISIEISNDVYLTMDSY